MPLSPVRALLDPASRFPLPTDFTLSEYLQTEREFWALFPETEGRRVNFCQVGLTAQLYTDVHDNGGALSSDEAYFLLPCTDHSLRPVRMQALRHLTVGEYRMSRMTARKLGSFLQSASHILEEIHYQVLGAEVLADESEN
ncbi:MAG TPA: hypothetical protein VG456_28960 [Candidatus Sulfopaludibacter sp.]|jgi:hypothetical protein|nr:hypothetical protein [Candidatus Sulfopaludibacter sp.]